MNNRVEIEFNVPAVMRDGTVLRANVYRPAGPGPYPVALTRLPYGKDFYASGPFLDAARLARAGYIVVIQDVRGRYASEGAWELLRHEVADGYDTVEWAARLPGANGAVGMWGMSYFGFTQWAAAAAQPPHLKALVPTLTWADARDGLFWRGGAAEIGLLFQWQLNSIGFDVLARRLGQAPPDAARQAALELAGEIDRLRAEGYWQWPLGDFAPVRRLGLIADLWDEMLAQPYSAAQCAPYAVQHAQVAVPSLNVGGWYDIFCQGTLDNFMQMRRAGLTPEARQARLLMGPWTHLGSGHVLGEVDFGFGASMYFMNLETDLTGLTQRWFDYWLKGIDNGVAEEPPVRLFVMGENAWRNEQEWPPARARAEAWYLREDGLLSPQPPGDEAPDQFVYDPADPTPTWGGALLMNPLFGAGPQDQGRLAGRDDVLIYTSPPLARDLEVIGRVTVRLWAASDAPDTDFVARLIDVHPDGLAQNLTDGILRARYRDGGEARLLEPGRAYEFEIDLWSTANLFKAGHRVRLDIASASFPRWDRNPNTGAAFGAPCDLRPARQTVLHDAAHPSRLVLPVIPR